MTNTTKPKMNRQEVFDTVAEHLAKQGKAARKDNDADIPYQCMYRAPDGSKCAVGILIPDHVYTDAIEGETAQDRCVINLLPFLTTSGDEYWLSELQGLHDADLASAGLSQWARSMAQLAKEYSLSTEALKASMARHQPDVVVDWPTEEG